MKKIIRLTESDLTRIVKRVIMEQNDCDTEWATVKTALEKKRNMKDFDVTPLVCKKDQTGFIKEQVPTIDDVKLKCIHGKMGEWCTSKGYTYKGPQL